MVPIGEYQLRQQIVRVGQLLYEKGFISSSDGNISARMEPGRILITPSGLHKGFLEPDVLLLVDEDGYRVGTSTTTNRQLKPTSELPMHLEIYRLRPDIGSVVHAHPPTTIALSIAGIPLADCLLPEVIVSLGLIPTTEYATPSSEESVRAIREFIGNHDALVLQRHGTVTVGRDPMQGFMRLETVEQNARIAYMLAQLGVTNPLSPDEVSKLLKQREEMGLSKPGEAAEFCAVCGVCHTGSDHLSTMRSGGIKRRREGNSQIDGSHWAQNMNAQTLPPIDQPALDRAEIRDLVTQVVQKTLGKN
ncbi:MAG TPA: class II aldolase/adducin family protein [candidate division Zixibacteria bacterium]|nr:class II aldolase/adducin family protein [candidate division Zixibacteria bacterium]